MRGQSHCGDLCLVAYLGKKEGHQGGAEDSKPLGALRFLFFDLVRDHCPDRHADKREAQDPAPNFWADHLSDPSPEGTREAMIDDGSS